MDKKTLMAPYQQSFRIDDLLTRKASEQQPGHFIPPPLHSNSALQASGGSSKMENIPCQVNGKVMQ